MKLTLSEAIKNIKKFKNEYQVKRIYEAKDLLDIINNIHPCECFITASSRDNDEYYCDYISHYLKNDVCKIKINYDTRKRYSFYHIANFKNLSNYQINNVREKFEKPRGVGVLTKKKVADWMKYEQDVYLALKKEDERLDDKVEIFLKKIRKENIEWFNNDDVNKKYSGRIIRNGLEYNFSIENGYINEKIGIYYETSSDLDTFKILSDNRLNRPKKLKRILEEI